LSLLKAIKGIKLKWARYMLAGWKTGMGVAFIFRSLDTPEEFIF